MRATAAVFAACVTASLVGQARADEDDLSTYRDRFRLGMEQYKAGAVAEAIRIWGAIYEELGTKRGYRLAFNLARAYDTNGEATRAVERYRSFLDEASVRRQAGEKLEPIVLREILDADDRINDLNHSHGRIEVTATEDATLAQIDDTDPRLGSFTAYVAPGRHVITFGPGKADAERVEVTIAAGELYPTHPKGHVEPPVRPAALPPVDPMMLTKHVTKHPFSPVVLYASLVVTAGSVVAPVVAYSYAYAVYNTSQTGATPVSRNNAANSYPSAKSVAYGTLAIPITLGAVTGGLTTWYFAAAQDQTVSIGVSPTPGGLSASVTASF